MVSDVPFSAALFSGKYGSSTEWGLGAICGRSRGGKARALGTVMKVCKDALPVRAAVVFFVQLDRAASSSRSEILSAPRAAAAPTMG